MKKGWQTNVLDDVCELITCGVAARPDYVDSGIPFLSAKNVKNGEIVWTGYNCISEQTHLELTKNNKPKVGDILYTRVGSFGEAAVIEDVVEFSIFVSLTLIKPNRHLLNSYFLKYYLNSSEVKELAKSSITSSGVGNLNVGTVRQFPISFPLLPEQHRIVAILDEAFDGIATAKANAEKNLQNARALFESHLQAVFSQTSKNWEKKHLAEVAKDFGRGKSKHRPRNDPKLYGGKYPFIQTGDVRNSTHLINTYSQTYNEVGLAQSKLWPKGTLCITIAANIAETGILDFDSCFPDSVIGIVVDPDVISIKFLEYLLQSFKTILQAKGKGSAQDNINLGTFENQLFPFPSLKEQKQIVSTLDSLSEDIQHLESIYQQKLAALDELKKSLLHQAFSGQL